MEGSGRFLPERAPIDAYGNGGFRFADMSHRGSILCLPDGVHAWGVTDPAGITVETLASVLQQADAIDHLLIGMGLDLRPVQEALRLRLRQAGITPEPMSTGNAARTYNILLGENRKVAAALIAVP